MKIYDKTNIQSLRQIPILDNTQLYLYVILSSNKNIKIGRTTNIIQRIKSLSGSNAAGERISKFALSSPTYVLTIEETCHTHFNYCRIQGTEWFDGNKVTFEKVCDYVDSLFQSKGYETCNELRKKLLKEKELKEKNQI